MTTHPWATVPLLAIGAALVNSKESVVTESSAAIQPGARADDPRTGGAPPIERPRVGHIEQRGIEPVPPDERNGRPLQLFWAWFAANISVLGAPTLPLQPVSPRRTLIMVLSIPAGVFLGIALAIFLYGLSDKIQRPRDLATIEGLAYLGTFDLRRPSASQ